MTIDVSDLLGIPYKKNGRDIKYGFDCMGLAIEVERRFGHKLPDLDEYKEVGCNSVMFTDVFQRVLPMCQVIEINKPETAGDVILFKDSKGLFSHIGIYLEDGLFIHCNRYGVHIEKVNYFEMEVGKVYKWQ